MGISYIGETKIVWEQWSASVTTVVYRNTKGMVSHSDKDAHCLSASLKRHLCKMCKMEALENRCVVSVLVFDRVPSVIR